RADRPSGLPTKCPFTPRTATQLPTDSLLQTFTEPALRRRIFPKMSDELLALADRAQKGDETALPLLRELLKEPAVVDMLGGSLAKQAQLTLINKFSGQNLLFRESLTRKLDMLRDELAGPNPTPLESLLVERIVACWLHLHHLEANYLGSHRNS